MDNVICLAGIRLSGGPEPSASDNQSDDEDAWKTRSSLWCEDQRFPLFRCRLSAALIIAETSMENALARSARVR